MALLEEAIRRLLQQAPLGVPDDRRAADEARAFAHEVIDTPWCRPSCRGWRGMCLVCDGRSTVANPCQFCGGDSVGCHVGCGCPCGHLTGPAR